MSLERVLSSQNLNIIDFVCTLFLLHILIAVYDRVCAWGSLACIVAVVIDLEDTLIGHLRGQSGA